MNTIEAIAARRSIRRFTGKSVSKEDLEAILLAGIQAPSGKNRQPWEFYVVGEDKREEMLRLMRQGIEGCKARDMDTGSSEWTAIAMEKTSVTVFIFYPDDSDPETEEPKDRFFLPVVDVQSVGAAIQNMLLAAWDLGIGSLWICDVFYAYDELRTWLGAKGKMIAAVSFGHADESPDARPRKSIAEVTTWL
jgi:nitroreductase